MQVIIFNGNTYNSIEDMPAVCIAVVNAMGVTDAGIFGDILCARMQKKGVAALITDGVLRDVAGVRATGLPVWCQGAAAPPSVAPAVARMCRKLSTGTWRARSTSTT